MPDRPVVSNTTPLITLAGVGLLDLLPQLYGQIWIAEVVHREYQAGQTAREPDLDTLPWLIVRPVAVEPVLVALLDEGEAATITLATAQRARVVVLDEARGRRVAQRRGLATIGTLGVLLRAKQAGLIEALAPVIDAMVAQGRYIGPALSDQVLREAGEHTE